MSANLNEFTTYQLQVLLNVVVAKIVDEDLHREQWEKYFSEMLKSNTYAYLHEKRINEYETLQLFRVQILNAIVEVKTKEEIHSN